MATRYIRSAVMGPPMVNTDGTAYTECEVRNVVNNVKRGEKTERKSGVGNLALPTEDTQRTRYALRYADSGVGSYLQRLAMPSGSCKYLQSLAQVEWHGRGRRFDPDQVHHSFGHLAPTANFRGTCRGTTRRITPR